MFEMYLQLMNSLSLSLCDRKFKIEKVFEVASRNKANGLLERRGEPSSILNPTHAGVVCLKDLFMLVGAIHYPCSRILQDSVGIMLGLHLHLTVTAQRAAI